MDDHFYAFNLRDDAVTEMECRVVEAVDTDALLDSLQRLVVVPSVSGSESAAQLAIAGQMRDRGMDVDVWTVDLAALAAHPAYNVEVERSETLGVVGVVGCHEGGRTLVLNGHIDVVPPGDPAGWRHSPWSGRFEDGWVYGRGSADMKGGLAAALAAVRAIGDAGVRLRGRVLVQSVVGEEDGGTGTLATILRGYQGDGAVVMEPTSLTVVPSHAGCLNFRITIRGRAAHGALRLEGVSAVEKFVPILKALGVLEARRNERARDPLFAEHPLPWPLSVGKVQAGNWASTVPERLVFEGRYGVAPGETLEDARRELEQAMEDAAATDPWLERNRPELEWWGGAFAPASTPLNHSIVSTVREAARSVTGVEPRLVGMTAGTDLRLLVNEGRTPGVLFGPGDLRMAHAPNEAVRFEEVVTAARALTLTILRFCGYHDRRDG